MPGLLRRSTEAQEAPAEGDAAGGKPGPAQEESRDGVHEPVLELEGRTAAVTLFRSGPYPGSDFHVTYSDSE